MRARLRTVGAMLPLLAMGSSCSEDERVAASCTLDTSITFNGHTYVAAESLPGLDEGEVLSGEHRGTGELGSCPGEPQQRVDVHKVVGVPVERAVFAEPEHGLMRSLRNGEAVE